MTRILPKNFQNHWNNPKNLIQVVIGPRQVGKTTTVTQKMDPSYTIYASADLPSPPMSDFISDHWAKTRQIKNTKRTLILDEVQKIDRWSETVKGLWDEDVLAGTPINIWLLGSSALQIEKGLSESLAGRFEIIYFPHWIYKECHAAFGATLEDYLKFGGYPKAYSFRDDDERLFDYIHHSIIETTLGRDILSLHSVDKPALLRQLFSYISKLPSQILSYEKILGHVQGKGNSATLVHYAELLNMAFMLIPLFNYSNKPHRIKKTRPKWIIPNPMLIDPSVRKEGLQGFVLENMVGSHLVNLTFGSRLYQIHYWRVDDYEVDFVLTREGEPLLLIEVKTSKVKKIPSGRLLSNHGIHAELMIIDSENIERFLMTTSIEEIIKSI